MLISLEEEKKITRTVRKFLENNFMWFIFEHKEMIWHKVKRVHISGSKPYAKIFCQQLISNQTNCMLLT